MIKKDCLHLEQNGKECACLTKLVCAKKDCSFYKSKEEYYFSKEKNTEGRIVGVVPLYFDPEYRKPLDIKKERIADDLMEEWKEKYKTEKAFKDFFKEEWPKACENVRKHLAV